jgi:N-acetylmuramoyl-L-alanine amidase
MATVTRLNRRPAGALLASAALVVVLASARPAAAQTAAVLFQRAASQEQQLAETAPVESVRRVARAYELVVLRYPRSGYCDNALWQAGSLLERAFARSAEPRDKDGAVRFYAWVAKEYPSSSLARQATDRAAALKVAPAISTLTEAEARAPSSAQSTGTPVVVRGITRTPLPRGDRITIELSAESPYTGERLSNPDRVFFDFPNATAAAPITAQIRALQGQLVKAVRVGSPTRGVTRVVLELEGTPRYSAFPLYGPFRLVIDVEAATPLVPATTPAPTATPTPVATPTPTVGPSPVPPSSTGRGDYSLARQLGLGVAKVVIDPGHGGHDPGAMSNGVTEAELVLDVALRLEKLLAQIPGVEVVLTRRTNEYIPLEERTAIANREPRADLFLSIHANSHRQSAVRGIETYFLNFATNPDAEAVAARENAASVQTMGTLPAIVKAIALNNKIEESREFAALLQTSLVRRMRTQTSATRDLGVKQAPFVVLIGAQMPSVLTEIAFLTNRAEASLLKQPTYRQNIAQALRDAIVKYQGSLKRVSTPASQPPR